MDEPVPHQLRPRSSAAGLVRLHGRCGLLGHAGAYQTSAGSYSISATVVPAGVTQVALRFDLYSTTGGVAPTSTTKSMWLTDVTMATASTATALLVKRTNLVKNPSFESDASNWTPSSASLSRVTTQASVGTASCSVTTSPTVATNLVTNPNFETSTSDGPPAATPSTSHRRSRKGKRGAGCARRRMCQWLGPT